MGEPALALGTVQFGLAYGVAGRGEPVPEPEVCEILARACSLGIERLDTAPGYGTIEERLDGLAGDHPFSIVTKVPPAPRDSGADAASDHVRASIERSRARLGDRLAGILFHDASDLQLDQASRLWEAARAAAGDGTGLGPSCYDAETLADIEVRFPVTMAQLPGNALDQGVARFAGQTRVEISLRSVFLQGLLLMPLEEASARVPAARPALERWHAFGAEAGLRPLDAALSVAKGLKGIAYCLIGVDTLTQLEQVVEAWESARPVAAPQLDTRDPDVIDPRRWAAGKK